MSGVLHQSWLDEVVAVRDCVSILNAFERTLSCLNIIVAR